MRTRGHRAGAIAVGLLLLAIPVAAQDGDTRVSFRQVGFTIPAPLGDGVDVTVTPGDAPDAEGIGLPLPPAVVLTLHGGAREGARVPRVGAGQTVIRAYRIADLEPYAGAARQVDALRVLLEDRPELGASATGGSDALPFLPATAAPQIVRARPVYVDLPTVSGVSYLAAYEQAGEGGPEDAFPLTSTSVMATFQGLSSDGTWYVSIVQALETSLFPEQPSLRDIRRAARDWDAYLLESSASLESAAPRDFTPSLRAVDALVTSLSVAPPASSDPSPSPASTAPPVRVQSPSPAVEPLPAQ